MSSLRHDQYREALRRGHLAVTENRLAAAAAAYREAADLAPDRAVPHASLGAVLDRMGRGEEAESAFGAALQRDPRDEASLRGRARLRADGGRPLEAAADLEVLSEILERAGRIGDAHAAAVEALDLAESRSRRRIVERLVARLLEDGTARPAAAPDGPPEGPLDASAEVSLEERRRAAEALVTGGDPVEARRAVLALAEADRAAGRNDAAIDACLMLLAVTPSDVDVQLELAANQAVLGWVDVAVRKIALLGRLADLGADETAGAAIRAFAVALGRGPSGPTGSRLQG